MNIKEIMDKTKQKFPKIKFAAIAVLVGLALIIFPFSFNTADDTKSVENQYADAFDITALERKLENILSACDGVGRVDVMLTQKTGMENVYEHDISQNIKNQGGDDKFSESYSEQTKALALTQDSSYGENPVIIKQNFPQLMGAVVVCDGGGNDKVRLKILEAVKALTGITADNISIIKMKSN